MSFNIFFKYSKFCISIKYRLLFSNCPEYQSCFALNFDYGQLKQNYPRKELGCMKINFEVPTLPLHKDGSKEYILLVFRI